MPRAVDLTGQAFGRWTVIGRASTRISPSGARRTYWHCRCSCGVEREVLAALLVGDGSKSCGCHRSEVTTTRNRATRQSSIGYYPAHRRLDRDLGRAKTHTCADCRVSPAAEWSYDHMDPDELTDPQGRPYSTKPEHYSPRCISCHRLFDNRRTTDA